MWQCQTNWPAVENVALTRVTSPGSASTVSLRPRSHGCGPRAVLATKATVPVPSSVLAGVTVIVCRLTTSNPTSWMCIGWASMVVL